MFRIEKFSPDFVLLELGDDLGNQHFIFSLCILLIVDTILFLIQIDATKTVLAMFSLTAVEHMMRLSNHVAASKMR